MPDAPLSRSEHGLASLLARDAPDAFLVDLIRNDVGMGVGLLLNGMIVAGALAPPERMAEDIDAQLEVFAQRSEKRADQSDEDWAETLERVRTRATRYLAASRAADEQVGDKLDAYDDPDAVPGDLAEQVILRHGRSHLTLVDAQVYAPGQPGMTRVPVMRVALRQIAGWWVLHSDETGSSQFAL